MPGCVRFRSRVGGQSGFGDTAGKKHGWKKNAFVYSSSDGHIVHPFWIALLAPSCGAAK
jgi:hypothetical protein